MFPFRRAYRAVFRKRKPAKKAAKRRARQKSNVKNGLVHVKKLEIEPRISVAGNATTFGAESFELADLPQYLTYASLYEEYRIQKITYSWKALSNVSTVPPVGVNAFTSLGMIHTIIDNNDAVVPTSIQTMMNDSSYRGTVSSRNHTRTFVPKFLNVAGTAQAQQSTGWLLTDNPNVSHYGIKWAFEGGITLPAYTSFIVEPIITYYIAFRNPK